MSGIRVDQNILNQKATPAFYAANYYDRPTAGYNGRVFISIDTKQIFRDTGTAWDLISDAGSGSSNLAQVTLNGNDTPYGINITSGGLFLLGKTNGSIFFADGGSGQFTTDATTLFWDNTNKRLGLGTATPGVRLDVHSSSGTTATFNGTGSTNALLTFQSASTSKWSVGNFVSSTVANDFNIYDNVNTVSRLQVHNTGVVNIPSTLIIGTTTPTSSYALDVTGSGNFTSSLLVGTTITGNSFIPNGATVPTNGMYLSASNTLAFSTNSTNRLLINSVGISTFNNNIYVGASSFTSPNGADTFVGVFGGQDCSLILQDSVQLWELYVNDDFYINYGTTSAITIKRTTGNVLINTTTDAGYKLDVNGTFRASNVLSGTYTPSISLTGNISSITPLVCQYLRVGNTVTVSGSINVTATTSGVGAYFDISLPITSGTFTTYSQLGGVGSSNITYNVSTISCITGRNTGTFNFIPTYIAGYTIYFNFTYQII